MTDISFCDNKNCIFNKEYKCINKEDIILDENAVCSSAIYNKGDDEPERPPDDEKKKKDKEMEIFRKENEDWFKMI